MTRCPKCKRDVQVFYDKGVSFRKPYKVYCVLCKEYIKTIDPVHVTKLNERLNAESRKRIEAEKQAQKQAVSNVRITCPYCKSQDCKKLTSVSRGVSFGLFGFGSSKIGKQWHCNRCKSDF